MDTKIKDIEKIILEKNLFHELKKSFFNYIQDYENFEETFGINFLDENNFAFLEKSFSICYGEYEKIRYKNNFSIRVEQKIFNKKLKENYTYVLEYDNLFNLNDTILFFEQC